MTTGFLTARAAGALLLAAVLAAGCSADGAEGGFRNDGSGPVTGGDGGAGSGTLRNDGSTPTDITENGTQLPGRFICEGSAQKRFGARTEVGGGGLIGEQLVAVLSQAGLDAVSDLLASVANPERAIDGNFNTYSSFTLTAGLLGPAINSVDQSVLPRAGDTVAAGDYAVFGVTFPAAVVQAALLSSVTVTTYLDDVAQESNVFDQAAIVDLLGTVVSGDPAAYIGVKTTKPYDRATIMLTPMLLDADVGEALRVHEMCMHGRFVMP